MDDLGDWLKTLGLERYAQAFADNDVDFDVLALLSEADLEKLGLSLGHRRKVLRALAERMPATAPDAERRQVTVMFCDLVGSTQLATALDPEDMGMLVRRFKNACTDTITRFEGFVARFMGDGAMAYFGYPRAHEDAAEQAVRAALALVEEISRIPRQDGGMLQTRIGIATGTVFIGDVVGEGPARELTVVGETPNLAARLQGLAEPNTIIIGNRTHQLLGKRFEYRNLGEHSLKGFPVPMLAWRVMGEISAESRFAASRTAVDGAFVGRGDELETLLDRWQLASTGRGRAVVVTADAGMGKSRLVETFIEGLGGARRHVVTCQCSPYHTNSALYPVLRNIERAARFEVDDGDDAKLVKLEAFLGPLAGESSMSLLASALSLPTGRYAPLDVSPAQRKTATLAALVDIILRRADDAPVLLLLEDAHWIDPTTRDLWTCMIDAMAAARVMLIVTARPEFHSPWADRGRVDSIELVRLPPAHCAKLAADVASPQSLRPELIDDIVAKADGVPLYVEELTKAAREAMADHLTVPATLHDSLMARLDRLGPAKEIAYIAAVIGLQFPLALLADVSGLSRPELEAELQRLVDAGLAFRVGRASEPTYSFKHALLCDVAYENLLRGRRQQLHEAIANSLVTTFPALAEQEPEVVAHHFGSAGNFELALTYRERAADRAVAKFSYAEAVAHFSAALADAAKLEAGEERMRRELALLLKAGPPLAILKGERAVEVGELYERAHGHAILLQDESATFKTTWGLWFNALTGRRLDHAASHADTLVTLAHKSGDGDLVLEGLHCRWSTAYFRGETAKALEASEDGLRRYDREKHAWMGPVFGGHDPGVCAFGVHSVLLAYRGRHDEARRHLERGLELAETLRQPMSIAHALMNLTMVDQVAHDYGAVEEHSRRLLEVAEKYNMLPQRAHALFLLGWKHAYSVDLGAGISAMQAATAIGPYFRVYAALLAECHEKSGAIPLALATIQPALESVTEAGVGLGISELYRLRGLCLLPAGALDGQEGMKDLRLAVEIANRHGETILELKAATSLARTLAGMGRPAEGLERMRELCESVRKERVTPPITEALAVISAR
ncbi:MAG: adenylate/guanylate cyclase domain-containing protein [Usitatibacter sp.]